MGLNESIMRWEDQTYDWHIIDCSSIGIWVSLSNQIQVVDSLTSMELNLESIDIVIVWSHCLDISIDLDSEFRCMEGLMLPSSVIEG